MAGILAFIARGLPFWVILGAAAVLFIIWCILTASALIAVLKRAGAARRTAPPGKAILLYDGRCTFCEAQSRRLLSLAGPGALERLSFQEPEVLARFPGISREECLRAMQLVLPDGRVYSGVEAAVRALAARRPWGWITLLYYLPGLRQAADFLYRLIARYRYHLK